MYTEFDSAALLAMYREIIVYWLSFIERATLCEHTTKYNTFIDVSNY